MLEGCHIDVNFKLGYTPFDQFISKSAERIPVFEKLLGAQLFYEH
jgi:hypothetical protein